ncbi:hypothetical protein BKA65DRAFT_113734 [Rhexocercosporidium sp. MPI-PUGE-AT-0058]|nr:hypothetical protein BKA65DRAFT_113734 [Rhexocercosporidium sp. MPI-PUGE-AT-0058]
MNLKEAILPVCVFDLGSQAFFAFVSCLRRSSCSFRFSFGARLMNLCSHLISVDKALNRRSRSTISGSAAKRPTLHHLVGYLFWSAWVAANAHVREGPGDPIIGPITTPSAIAVGALVCAFVIEANVVIIRVEEDAIVVLRATTSIAIIVVLQAIVSVGTLVVMFISSLCRSSMLDSLFCFPKRVFAGFALRGADELGGSTARVRCKREGVHKEKYHIYIGYMWLGFAIASAVTSFHLSRLVHAGKIGLCATRI